MFSFFPERVNSKNLVSDVPFPSPLLTDGTQIGWTALHSAAKNRNLEVDEFLVGLEKIKNEEEAQEAALRQVYMEAHLEAMRNQFAAQEQAELDRLTSEANAAEKMGNDEMERVLVQIRMPGAR